MCHGTRSFFLGLPTEGDRSQTGQKRSGVPVWDAARRELSLGLGCFVDLHDLVAADALEEQEEQEVDRGHRGRDVGIRFQSGAVTGLVGFDDSLLLRGLFLGFLGGGQLGPSRPKTSVDFRLRKELGVAALYSV